MVIFNIELVGYDLQFGLIDISLLLNAEWKHLFSHLKCNLTTKVLTITLVKKHQDI